MTDQPNMVPLFFGSGGATVGCYPGMQAGLANAAVSHVYVVGKETCACGAVRLPPGTIGLPAVFPSSPEVFPSSTLPAA